MSMNKWLLFFIFLVLVAPIAMQRAQAEDIWGPNGTGQIWKPNPKPPVIVIIERNYQDNVVYCKKNFTGFNPEVRMFANRCPFGWSQV